MLCPQVGNLRLRLGQVVLELRQTAFELSPFGIGGISATRAMSLDQLLNVVLLGLIEVGPVAAEFFLHRGDSHLGSAPGVAQTVLRPVAERGQPISPTSLGGQ